MRSLSFLPVPRNQKTLSWTGGVIVVAVAALWTAFVYVRPPSGEGAEGKREVTAIHGAICVGGDVKDSTLKTGSGAGSDYQPQGY
jgi:hypothetical protein